MKILKSKGLIEVPSSVSAFILLQDPKMVDEVWMNLKKLQNQPDGFVIAANIKVLYRKDTWEIAEG